MNVSGSYYYLHWVSELVHNWSLSFSPSLVFHRVWKREVDHPASLYNKTWTGSAHYIVHSLFFCMYCNMFWESLSENTCSDYFLSHFFFCNVSFAYPCGSLTVHHGAANSRGCHGMSQEAFQALLDAAILDHIRSCVSQKDSSQDSQEEAAAAKERHSDNKFGNHWPTQ